MLPALVQRIAYSVRLTASFLFVASSLTLTACKKDPPPKVAADIKGVDQLADQVVFGQRTLVTDRGLLRAEVESDTALFYDDNTRMDMRIVRTKFFNSAGALNAVLTSRTGRYMTRDQVLEARGMVVIKSVDGRTLNTEQIKFDQRVNQISSDSAFTLTEGDREVSGVGFVSDPDMNNLRILSHSKAKAPNVKMPGN